MAPSLFICLATDSSTAWSISSAFLRYEENESMSSVHRNFRRDPTAPHSLKPFRCVELDFTIAIILWGTYPRYLLIFAELKRERRSDTGVRQA